MRPAARGADLGGVLDLVARARREPDFGAGLTVTPCLILEHPEDEEHDERRDSDEKIERKRHG